MTFRSYLTRQLAWAWVLFMVLLACAYMTIDSVPEGPPREARVEVISGP